MYYIQLDGNSTLDPIKGYVNEKDMVDPNNACEAINIIIQRETEHLGVRPEFRLEMQDGDVHFGHIVVHTKEMEYVNQEWIKINALPVMTMDDVTQEAFVERMKQQDTKGARHA